MAWAKNGTPHTLSGVGDDLSITDLAGNKFNEILIHTFDSGTKLEHYEFNNDSGTNYADRGIYNGGTDITQTSQTKIDPQADNGGGSVDAFFHAVVIGVSSQEKLLISHGIHDNGAGAANAPARFEEVGKWANTANTITRVDCTNDGAGDFNTNSNMSVFGTD